MRLRCGLLGSTCLVEDWEQLRAVAAGFWGWVERRALLLGVPGQPVTPQAVALAVACSDQQLAGIIREARAADAGQQLSSGVQVPAGQAGA